MNKNVPIYSLQSKTSWLRILAQHTRQDAVEGTVSVACVSESPQGGHCLSGGITCVIASVATCARKVGYGDFAPTIYLFLDNPDGPRPLRPVGLTFVRWGSMILGAKRAVFTLTE